jgi:hypothetical protein
MLFYKWWIDTQRWFLLAVFALAAQVVALYMSYPLDPATSFPNGALGVLPSEMMRIRTGDFRAYVWVRWFSTTMLLFWPVFVVALAGSGFESERGREYLLSLPMTRRRIALTRLTLVLAEIAVFTLLPSLLVCAMAPLQGQRFPITDALAHSAMLCTGGFALFGLTMFLRTVMMNDAAAFTAAGTLVLLCLILTFVARDLTPYSIVRVMNGADYFFADRVPWTGLAASVGVGTALVWASLRAVERRDF